MESLGNVYGEFLQIGGSGDLSALISSIDSSCGNSSDSSGTHDETCHQQQPPRKRRRTTKHIPHSEQPEHRVRKRNTRERNRVRSVNDEFKRLRQMLPVTNRGKRISKENILKFSILYIRELHRMIREHDYSTGCPPSPQLQGVGEQAATVPGVHDITVNGNNNVNNSVGEMAPECNTAFPQCVTYASSCKSSDFSCTDYYAANSVDSSQHCTAQVGLLNFN